MDSNMARVEQFSGSRWSLGAGRGRAATRTAANALMRFMIRYM